MFEPATEPRLFGLPPGADFPAEVVNGLLERLAEQPPESIARTEIFVNTRRMQRRMKDLFSAGPARLLPRIRLLTDLGTEAALAEIPPPVSPLRRRLELTQLVSRLLDGQPDLAPRSALFDLADSLAALMDEMQGEGVSPQTLAELEVSDQSGHWQRSLNFVMLVEQFLRADHEAPDAEARQRRVVEALEEKWGSEPPQHPIIIAGSTGSRGATARFMHLVAGLPQGALILPGFDFDLPDDVWHMLRNPMTSEDHPQYRFARLLNDMGVHPSKVSFWTARQTSPSPDRNRLISLALRPAPVTDQWMTEGAGLGDLSSATSGMSLIEADSTRAEAGAIALVLRDAAEAGKVAALITPDRVLSRQVSAALDRWNIIPDDSAGRPLPLTAPGRFLLQVAALFGEKPTSESLLALLKHPLSHSSKGTRGPHLLNTRELELKLRRFGPPFPRGADLLEWAEKGTPARIEWAAWLADCLEGLEDVGTRSLSEHLEHHLALTEKLARGVSASGSGELWLKDAGREAAKWMAALEREASHGGRMTAFEYQSLVRAVLQRGEVRDVVSSHPGIMIWGTLEARVQGADVVVLAGLNEGVWPEAPSPDPWLNRQMRSAAGLLLPERRIGLAAHDFQQAAAAKQVVLTRAIRDAEAQTVPSRWINRLTNLLAGLSDDSARQLQSMRQRGTRWLRLARAIEDPSEKQRASNAPARRPSPCPPVRSRPKRLSITEIQTLIRDPYAIYARHVLRLEPLDPLRQMPDAPLRGTVLHEILETFAKSGRVEDVDESRVRLMQVADTVLRDQAPWPAAQRMWRARILRVADWFLTEEQERQADREIVALERRGEMLFPDLELTLRGKVDRIDRLPNGALAIYDYKTGSPPNAKVQAHFDKQLGLAAMMAEAGALKDIEAARVAEISYIGLGANPKTETKPWNPDETSAVHEGFVRLIASYRDRSRGYTARRAVDRQMFERPYDHLARYGEWDESDEPDCQEVGS